MAIFEKIQQIIIEELGREPEEITLETTFDDIDADSLDVFQVISEIEDAFDIEFEDEDNLKTIADLVDYVNAKIQ